MLAKQVAVHMAEEDVIKVAPFHADFIQNMGINKYKQDRGKGEKPPPLIHAQKMGINKRSKTRGRVRRYHISFIYRRRPRVICESVRGSGRWQGTSIVQERGI